MHNITYYLVILHNININYGIKINYWLFVSVVQGVQQAVCQCLPPSASHDQPRRECRPSQVQVSRVRKGFQVQASLKGHSHNML